MCFKKLINRKEKKSMAKLSPPWVTFYRKMEALFGADPQIHLMFDEESYEIKVRVDNATKAEAIAQLLPLEKTFGNVTVNITVIPANIEQDTQTLFRAAFDGNPAMSYVQHINTPFAGEVDYVVFANRVVQFQNDNIGDINGNMSTLYEDIARDVFEIDGGVFYCTDTEMPYPF